MNGAPQSGIVLLVVEIEEALKRMIVPHRVRLLASAPEKGLLLMHNPDLNRRSAEEISTAPVSLADPESESVRPVSTSLGYWIRSPSVQGTS